MPNLLAQAAALPEKPHRCFGKISVPQKVESACALEVILTITYRMLGIVALGCCLPIAVFLAIALRVKMQPLLLMTFHFELRRAEPLILRYFFCPNALRLRARAVFQCGRKSRWKYGLMVFVGFDSAPSFISLFILFH